MEQIVAALADQHDELAGMLADFDPADWDRPSRCDGWTVSDVVLHLAQSDEMALASVESRFTEYLEDVADEYAGATNVDEAAARGVASERGRPATEVHQRWLRGAATLREALVVSDPRRRVQWVAGDLSTRTLATTRLAEAWIHTGDVAFAFGVAPAPSDRLRHIARLAWRTLPYAFARAGEELSGPVAFELVGPNGDEWKFAPDEPAVTTVRGSAADLCVVAGQRADAAATSLKAEGPDGDAVLALVRTFA
jgi:uncharacterized protein (TIGR03084 family)